MHTTILKWKKLSEFQKQVLEDGSVSEVMRQKVIDEFKEANKKVLAAHDLKWKNRLNEQQELVCDFISLIGNLQTCPAYHLSLYTLGAQNRRKKCINLLTYHRKGKRNSSNSYCKIQFHLNIHPKNM